MLVTTGERDFRVPFTQSIQLFAALQRQQVPSRLVVFPGEGHWIQKPQNAKQWYELTLAWLAQYLPP
jgi:dipeptidyl aminopeptidase/acylaminoacyl peptidase